MSDVEIAQLLDRLMRRIHAGLNAKASDFDTYDVGPAGGILLLTLADIEPAQATDLVQALQRDKSQVTRALAGLERKGLIEKHADPEDGRALQLALTVEGHRVVERLTLAVADVLEGLLTPLSGHERVAFRSLLGKL